MAKYITKQRKILQDYLSLHTDEELSAKKVAEDLSQQNLSLSAIYRNLADMQAEQLVVQCAKNTNREFYFRYIGDADCVKCFHLYCKSCNKIEHLSPEETDNVKKLIFNKSQYMLDIQNTQLYGFCKNCQQ